MYKSPEDTPYMKAYRRRMSECVKLPSCRPLPPTSYNEDEGSAMMGASSGSCCDSCDSGGPCDCGGNCNGKCGNLHEHPNSKAYNAVMGGPLMDSVLKNTTLQRNGEMLNVRFNNPNGKKGSLTVSLPFAPIMMFCQNLAMVYGNTQNRPNTVMGYAPIIALTASQLASQKLVDDAAKVDNSKGTAPAPKTASNAPQPGGNPSDAGPLDINTLLKYAPLILAVMGVSWDDNEDEHQFTDVAQLIMSRDAEMRGDDEIDDFHETDTPTEDGPSHSEIHSNPPVETEARHSHVSRITRSHIRARKQYHATISGQYQDYPCERDKFKNTVPASCIDDDALDAVDHEQPSPDAPPDYEPSMRGDDDVFYGSDTPYSDTPMMGACGCGVPCDGIQPNSEYMSRENTIKRNNNFVSPFTRKANMYWNQAPVVNDQADNMFGRTKEPPPSATPPKGWGNAPIRILSMPNPQAAAPGAAAAPLGPNGQPLPSVYPVQQVAAMRGDYYEEEQVPCAKGGSCGKSCCGDGH